MDDTAIDGEGNLQRKRVKTLNEKVERICAIGVTLLTAISMLWLWAASVLWTQTFWDSNQQEYVDAFMPRIRDGVKGNLFFSFALIMFLIIIYFMAKKWMKPWHMKLFLFLEIICSMFFCWNYIRNLEAVQWADFARIYQIAHQFLNGDFSQFEPGNYLATYPHQLGLVCFMMGIIRFVGDANAIPTFQFINCVCVGGIFWWGYQCVHNIWEKKEIELIYLLIQGMCFPLYFYTPLVYGEIISVMFLLVTIANISRMLREHQMVWWRIAVTFGSAGLAVCARKNSLIVLIAIGIIILVVLIKEKNWKIGTLLLVLVASLLLPLLLQNVVFGKYNKKAAMPSIVWIYIGIQNGSGFGYGAYDGKAGILYEAADYNPEVAAEMAKEVISERMEYFKENPKSAVEFFKEKVLWQWISPTYMCFSNTRFREEGYPVAIAYDINLGKARENINEFMDRYQSLVYLLVVIGTFGLAKNRGHFCGFVWSVIFLGGFFFSVLWEAKTRYTYPYFVMMLPICAYGIHFLSETLICVVRSTKGDKLPKG